jgi:hypothetical protein
VFSHICILRIEFSIMFGIPFSVYNANLMFSIMRVTVLSIMHSGALTD